MMERAQFNETDTCRKAFQNTCERPTISGPPLLDSPRSFIWAPPGQGVPRMSPQSRGRHVPGITNYAPRTIIIS